MKIAQIRTKLHLLWQRYFAAYPDGTFNKLRQLVTNLDDSYFSNDPIARRVLTRGNWKSVLFVPFLMISLAVIGLFFVGAWLGYLHTPSSGAFIGSLDDRSEWVVNFLLLPLLVTYYLLVPPLIQNVFDSLESNGIFDNYSRQDFDLYASWFKNDFNTPGWYWVSLFVAVVVSFAITYFLLFDSGFTPPQGWHYFKSPFSPYIIFGFLSLILFWYSFAYTAIRLVLFHLSLRYFYGQMNLNFQPLHEDGYGGLGPIVNVTKTYVGWLGPLVLGTLIAAMRISQQNEPLPSIIILLIGVVFAVLVLGLVLPLWSTQTYLRCKRREALKSINVTYETNKELVEDQSNMNTARIKELDKLMLTRINLISVYPQGPINIQAIVTALILNLALPLFIAFVASSLLP